MENITAIIAETIFMEVEQIVDLQYEDDNSFNITDNCGYRYIMNINRIFNLQGA